MLLNSLLDLVTENTPCRIDIRVEADGIRAEATMAGTVPVRVYRIRLTEALIRDSCVLPENLLLGELKRALDK